MKQELERFKSHVMNEGQRTASDGIRRTTIFLAEQILTDTPPGREQELALESLEQALMWANKAIAMPRLPLFMGVKVDTERGEEISR